MAGKIRAIKGRIKAVGNIQRITKTMQMIATARFQALQKQALSSQAYAHKIQEVTGELASALAGEGSVEHPLLSAPSKSAGRELVLLLSSNRGLCGGYNGQVLRAGFSRVQAVKDAGKSADVEIVGKKGVGYAKFNRYEVAQYHSQFTDNIEYAQVERLAEDYMAGFTAGQYDAVWVAYTAFETMSRQPAKVLKLLPLENPAESGDKPTRLTNYEFSPPADELLASLLPVTVKTTLFQCFNESQVSEQIARMVAMKAATDAAVKMRKDLTRQYNRARQAAITTELTEIIGGAAALE